MFFGLSALVGHEVGNNHREYILDACGATPRAGSLRGVASFIRCLQDHVRLERPAAPMPTHVMDSTPNMPAPHQQLITLRMLHFMRLLALHPNVHFIDTLLTHLTTGFHIGYLHVP